jgi:hypothetical protein
MIGQVQKGYEELENTFQNIEPRNVLANADLYHPIGTGLNYL